MKRLTISNKKKRIIKENMQLGAMTLPAIVLRILFSYLPLFGIILAFKNYKVPKGIWGSDWADPWYKNFMFLITSQDAFRVVRNTILLNGMFIFAGIACSVIFALLLFEVKKSIHIKIYQTFSILPSFLSWVAVSYIVYALFANNGLFNSLILKFGGEKIGWYQEAAYWPVILLVVKIWHGVGLSCIVYYASLMGIDSELFEAADMDGASKLQKIIHISIPHLVPIVTIMMIMDIGSIFNADFGLFYNVTRNQGALYATTDVIDTYIYRALMDNGNIGMSSAGSFLQSVVCFITLVATNAIVRKKRPENALF